MKNGVKVSCLFLFAVLGMPSGAASPGEVPELRDVRLRVLSWSGAVEGVMLRSGPGPQAEWLPVHAVDYVRSRFLEVKTGPDLVFYRWEELEDGTRVPVEDGRVRVEGMGETLLVLITGRGGNQRGYQAMPESLEDFPAGGYRFFNASSMGVLVGVGEERRPLPTGRSVTMVPEVDEGAVGVLIQLAGVVEGDPRLVYSNRLARREGQRLLFFVADSERGRVPVQVKRIMEGTRTLQPPPTPLP